MDCYGKIVKALKDKGISFYRIEKDLGFSNGYIGKIKDHEIGYDKLNKIADYLNMPIRYFIEEDYQESEQTTVEMLQTLRDDVRGLLDVQRDMTPAQVESMMNFAKFLKSQGEGGEDAD